MLKYLKVPALSARIVLVWCLLIVIILLSIVVTGVGVYFNLQVNTDLVVRFNSTLQIVQAAGEINRIQQGLFENYLECKVKDPQLLLVGNL